MSETSLCRVAETRVVCSQGTLSVVLVTVRALFVLTYPLPSLEDIIPNLTRIWTNLYIAYWQGIEWIGL